MRHSGKFLVAAALLSLPLSAFAADLWLLNAHLIDGRGGEDVPLVDLHVVDGRIASLSAAAVVSRKTATSQGASGASTTLDLQGAYLLPGYVDAHAHIGDPASAKRALLSGVTTARVLGDAYLKGLATRDLIRQHDVPGPEMLASAGHIRPVLGEPFILSFPQFGRYYAQPLHGVENVREVARAVIARGADVLKVGASERAGLAATDPRRQELTMEEMQAVVQEAAAKGLFVAAHAHGRSGANAAVRAGVRSIEHGTWIDDETLALMQQKGTFFVPTLAIMSPLGDPHGDTADDVALQLRTHAMMRPLREAVRKAHAMGVAVAVGTDGDYGEGESARVRPGYEVEELVKLGFTPLEAIRAATFESARVLGIEARTGSVAVGLEADLLVVDRDPRLDTSTLFEPMVVVNNGEVVLNRLY
jgi:imidazolonepropionase-like amidohydrolase